MYEYALCLVLRSTFDMVIKQIELIITITTNTKFISYESVSLVSDLHL